MVNLHHCLQAPRLDMGVYLGCRNICVPQHLLNCPEVGPAFQQITGKGVAQHVGRNLAKIEAGHMVLAPGPIRLPDILARIAS